MVDFFISYNSADSRWASWINWQLKQEGYTTIVQLQDFAPGSNFVLEMDKATMEAERTIAVLSSNFLNSVYTQPEWAAAFAQDPTGKKRKLVPVRVRNCELKGLLAQIVHIVLTDITDEQTAKQTLLDGLRDEGIDSSSKPDFPPDIDTSDNEQPRFPGALPPHWNVPHQRNVNFTGREAILDNLSKSLASGKHTAVTQAIAGLGGVGKTQIAIEYTYRYASEYEVVWWVRSETAATLGADYASLASELGLPEKDAAEQQVVVDAVRLWLREHSGWLLVFDNAEKQEDIRPYLPQGGTGHVLITSRNQVWGRLASLLSLDVFERDESVEFLQSRPRQDDADTADALAEELGDLPLALEQAAAYMDETGQSLAGYLALFKERRQALLERGAPPTDEYPDTVATTWGISFQRVEEESPLGADLLRLMAFLAPDDIPRSLISASTEHLPERLALAVDDALALDDAIAALRRYSLVEVDGEMLSVHRLVQTVVRDGLSDDEKKKWVKDATIRVAAAFPFDQIDPETWPASLSLLTQVQAVSSHTEEFKVVPEITGTLLNNLGVYLGILAQFKEAKIVTERALALAEEVYGSNHAEVAIRLHNLGKALHNLGDLEGARIYLERAVTIDKETHGTNHSSVAEGVNSLGAVLHDLGDIQGARAHYETALAIDEAIYGPSHFNVAIRVNNLGTALHQLDDLEGASTNYMRALTIFKGRVGPNHPYVATLVNNLGNVLRDLGDLNRARTYFELALAMDEKVNGPNHPSLAIRFNNLGSVFVGLGDLEGARANYEQALRIYLEFYGDEHPNTVMARDNLRVVEARMHNESS